MIRRPMILLFSMAVLTAFTEAQSDETESKSRFEGNVAGESRELVAAMVFHWCPAGEFTMGSPPSESGRNSFEAQQKEILKAGYWLQETEVTQKQWKDLMGTTPWKGQENVQDGENNAASYIDQRAAVEFCRKLTARELAAGRLPSGWAYSLPSEAQWEYGCRAGTRTAYSFGRLCMVGRFSGRGYREVGAICTSRGTEEAECLGLEGHARKRPRVVFGCIMAGESMCIGDS